MNKSVLEARMKFYLRNLYSVPLSDEGLLKVIQSDFDSSSLTIHRQFSDSTLVYKYAQRFLLLFQKEMPWEIINSYSLVEDYLEDSGHVIESLVSYNPLFVVYKSNSPPNKLHTPLLSGLCQRRELEQKRTVVLSDGRIPEFDIKPLAFGVGTTLAPIPVPVTTPYISIQGGENGRREV